jgi:hypothetical protein
MLTSTPSSSSFASPFSPAISYAVNDASNNAGSINYTYFFNVCANVDPLQLNYQAALPCNTTCGGVGSGCDPVLGPFASGPSPAFQYNNVPGMTSIEKCHRLGAPLTPGAPSNPLQYGLYDVTNPSRGLYMQYTGGDSCGGGPNLRSLKLWLLCDPGASGDISKELVVEAPGSCVYEIFVRTPYGCPAECAVNKDANGNTVLCNNHGFCEFDPIASNSRCFCNDGYGGSDCSPISAASSGLSSVGVGLICVGLFLTGTLGFLVYLWSRIRSLRLDTSAYRSLAPGPDDAPRVGGAGSTQIEQ